MQPKLGTQEWGSAGLNDWQATLHCQQGPHLVGVSLRSMVKITCDRTGETMPLQ